uniref:Uncharacterized protein n=1 Tax=Tetradesmus obliquus TaxID=3088 RepID=A0A383VS98_TETOB|eukprot:jgi/Sobl393_1/15087/SZX67709.1
MWLMLNQKFSVYFSLKLSNDKVMDCTNGTEAADCINSKDVAAEVLSLFYNYWWFTKPGSPERQRTKLVVDLGPLVGKAVAIVGSTDNGGSCKYQHPLVFPNQAGSTLFVYHDAAVMEFREHAVRFGGLAALGKRTKLVKLWNEVAGMQLGATLTYLAPANDIGIFPVTVKTSGGGGRRMGK